MQLSKGMPQHAAQTDAAMLCYSSMSNTVCCIWAASQTLLSNQYSIDMRKNATLLKRSADADPLSYATLNPCHASLLSYKHTHTISSEISIRHACQACKHCFSHCSTLSNYFLGLSGKCELM